MSLFRFIIPILSILWKFCRLRRVLRRLFEFLNMIHLPKEKKDSDQSRLNVAEEILAQCQEIPKLEGLA